MHGKFKPRLMFMQVLLCLFCAQPVVHAENNHLGTEAIINLPIDAAWQLFTSEAGLKSLGYSQVSISLQLGGGWQASGGDAVLGRLDNRILTLDPQHMLSFKPAVSPPVSQEVSQWTVLYFIAMGKDMTQLRWLDFFPDAQRPAMIVHQQQVGKLFDQLIRRYAPECEVCKLERERAAVGKQ